MRKTWRRTERRGHIGWRRLLSALSALVLAGVFASTAAPAAADNVGSPCEFAVVIAVRGTNAPAGTGSLHGDRLYESGGWGDELSPLIYHLDRSDLPYYRKALKYPASGPYYIDSINLGRAKLVKELNYLATACSGYRPPVVLVGHSQGAAVVQSALITYGTDNLTPAARSMIAAVVAYGDPQYKAGQPINAPGSQNTSNGDLGARSTDFVNQLNAHRYWGWPMGGSGQGWVYKIRSYCYANDQWCSSGSSDAVHNSYGETSTYDAFKWIEYMLSTTV